MSGNNAWLDRGDVPIWLCYWERRCTPAHQASITLAWLVYALIPAHLSGDSEICTREVWCCSSRNELFVQFLLSSTCLSNDQELSLSLQGHSALLPTLSSSLSQHCPPPFLSVGAEQDHPFHSESMSAYICFLASQQCCIPGGWLMGNIVLHITQR